MDDGRRPWPPPCFTVNNNMKRPRFSSLTTPTHFCPAVNLILYAFLILDCTFLLLADVHSYGWLRLRPLLADNFRLMPINCC